MWVARDPQIRDPELLRRYESWMDPEESGKWKRFHFAEHRHQYLVTRTLVRSVLSGYDAAVDPGDWNFGKNQYGKPFIRFPRPCLPLTFNISHTQGMIVVAVGLDRALGVDVECVGRMGRHEEIAERFFAPRETQSILHLPPGRRLERFFRLWTLKEAHVKALGRGLSVPFDSFGFGFPGPGEIEFLQPEKTEGAGGEFEYRSLSLSSDHLVALALARSRSSTPTRVRVFETVPLVQVREIPCPIEYATRV